MSNCAGSSDIADARVIEACKQIGNVEQHSVHISPATCLAGVRRVRDGRLQVDMMAKSHYEAADAQGCICASVCEAALKIYAFHADPADTMLQAAALRAPAQGMRRAGSAKVCLRTLCAKNCTGARNALLIAAPMLAAHAVARHASCLREEWTVTPPCTALHGDIVVFMVRSAKEGMCSSCSNLRKKVRQI